jgi:hypothetical protein
MPHSISDFPEKLINLHSREEFLRAKALKAIKGSEDLLHHVRIIEETMHLFDYFGGQYVHDDENKRTIQLLGIRVFNGAASSMKLLLSGYYQTAALQLRDMLETTFLLDYFSTDEKLIEAWRNDDKKSEEQFRPGVVRDALDVRDGFKERKRGAAYKRLCKLAGHPTFAGIIMVRPIAEGDAHYGPFFEFTTMQAVLSEFAEIIAGAGAIFHRFFKCKKRDDYEMKIHFIEVQYAWRVKFFGNSLNKSQLEEHLKLLVMATEQELKA